MPGYILKFIYTNHRGETARREMELETLEYLPEPGFGYKAGWFITGRCLTKNARRSFALSNVVIPSGRGANRVLIDIAIAQGKKL